MAVYGSVLESRLNLEFANEIKQFDYMMVSESSVDYILESKFSIKEVFKKLKELWIKFKEWVKEKFKKLREFIKKILHKTKTEVIDKKIQKPNPDNGKSYALAVRSFNNANNSDQQTDGEPKNLVFSYNTVSRTSDDHLTQSIKKITIATNVSEESKKSNYRKENNNSEYIDYIKQFYEEDTNRADTELSKIEDTDYSNIKKVDVVVSFKNVSTDNFISSVFKEVTNIKSATDDINEKLSYLNRQLDELEKIISDYDTVVKEYDKVINETERKNDTDEDDVKSQGIVVSILVNAMKGDISRLRSALLHWSKHSGNLTSAATQNHLIYTRLSTLINK